MLPRAIVELSRIALTHQAAHKTSGWGEILTGNEHHMIIVGVATFFFQEVST